MNDAAVDGEESPKLGTARHSLLNPFLHLNKATCFLGQASKPELQTSLLTTPDELIEQIADNLRNMFGDGADAYLSDGFTDFSITRFD